MSKPDHDPSIEHEPHLNHGPAAPDPSERAVDRILNSQHQDSGSLSEDAAKHSVFEEPDIFPGREAEVITQDWSCSECGYNLRGLPTGHRCPECGHIELYRPPPPEQTSFGQWYRQRKAAFSLEKSRLTIVFVAMFAWPWAVLGVLFNKLPNPWTLIVIGPALDEAAKIMAIVLVVELRPYWFKRVEQIWIAALASSIGFALIENFLYMLWFVPAPSFGLMLWRWIACTSLHTGCTAIAASGIARLWQKTDQEARVPQVVDAFRPLVFAFAFHALFCGCVLLFNMLDYGF